MKFSKGINIKKSKKLKVTQNSKRAYFRRE